MIFVKDLRIGNWVKHNDYVSTYEFPGTLFQVDISMFFEIARNRLSEQCLDPIELTEDILVKCKFHKDNYGLYVKVKGDNPYVSGCKIEYWIKQCEVHNEKVWDIYGTGI